MTAGTELILAIIYSVAKDKPKDIQKKYAKIMREILEIGEKEKNVRKRRKTIL